MNADNYCVYMHINKTNDKKYIGITKQKPENRWKNGLGYKDNTYFYRAIQKYSWSNFEHIIVTSNLSLENACKMEIEFIAKYKSSNPQYGYNIASGGNVNIPSKEGIEKIRCSMIGKKLSEETKRKLSECRKGEKNPNYGKYGEHSTHSRKIDQYDLNHNFIKTWGSLIDIKRELGIHNTAVESVCKGIRNTIGNYYWAYHGEKPLFNTDKRTRAIYQIDLATNTIVNKYNSAQEASKLLSISDANISQVCKCKRNSCGGYGWQYAEI